MINGTKIGEGLFIDERFSEALRTLAKSVSETSTPSQSDSISAIFTLLELSGNENIIAIGKEIFIDEFYRTPYSEVPSEVPYECGSKYLK